MEVIENQQAATTEEATNYKPRWDRAERRIGFSTAKLAKKPKLSDLSNLERLLARLGKEANSLNGIKVAIAARWCSTVYTNLTMQQIESIVTDCRSGDNPSKLLADPVPTESWLNLQLIVTLLPIRSLFVLMSAWNDSTLSSYQRPSFTPLRGRVLVSPCLTRK
ncbi:hypothetical protein [Sphingobium yanoikuyae]|uniref:hypothetical protein n=1 Tax=Sphingobium yanoikuyae TaxID=13690 RepID=UPI002FDDFBB9